MDIHVSPDKETALAQIAVANGVAVEQLVDDVLGQFLEENAAQLVAMRAAVDEADVEIAAGRFVDYDAGELRTFFDHVKRQGREQRAAAEKHAG